MSIGGRVHSLHISGGRPAAGSQHTDSLGSCAPQPACYSLGWDRHTDGSRYCLMPPPYGVAHNKCNIIRVPMHCDKQVIVIASAILSL